ncbi:3-oxoacid CoA-transferase subunit B [Guptibacillus hwajinpoensis]|uniref:Acetate CoA/acetoacetate CoA-transferase beta subunit n=1 Tax=Guptibacillus hwajinpoensis TaxID=208199 RepID=A0ABU0K0W9_9BACL|nr:3-oxoacid CoA-transferase subunit B [Alkalihalobacillus hemicentroti]MDQ0483005.1 acetate CoA/acetoacetate CoA-transferase beta subunit [Alkalihalobacillus hemicentroti]
MGMGAETRRLIAKRAAQEVTYGMMVNLGIGIPTLVADFIPPALDVMLHTENGILGMGGSPAPGKEDGNLSNAGGYPVSINTGASFFDSAEAFGMVRRGHLDLTILGALEVNGRGDIANWIVPGKRVPGMGGAIDLAQKAKKVIVLMSHTTKEGIPKILKECSLPLTVKEGAHMIITERAVMRIKNGELFLIEVMPGFSIEDVINSTEAKLNIELVGRGTS